MFSSRDLTKSIIYLTDSATDETDGLIAAMQREDFRVSVYPRNGNHLAGDFFGEADLIIIESRSFSLEELSIYSKLRTKYHGLLAILCEKMEDMLQVMLYEQGIDTLLIKPINPLLMLARIRALFRRHGKRGTAASLTFHGLEINGNTRHASYNGEEIPLSAREFDILWYMARNTHHILDRDRLYQQVFGVSYNGYDRSIDMYISRLRAKLAERTGLLPLIKTVRGKGYLFAAEE